MSDTPDEAEDGARAGVLSNRQVLGFIGRLWLRRPWLLAGTIALSLVSIGFDLTVPWAAGRMVDAVSAGTREPAWRAWGLFVGAYLGFLVIRNIAMRFWIPLAAGNMAQLVDEGYARVQSFSAQWHADRFAGATVRRLTRAMAGYDQVSDGVIVWLGPSLIVLVGLSAMMALRWPLVGGFALLIVAAYLATVLFVTGRYARPANLRSNALDSRIGGAVSDAVSGDAAVKSFGAETREQARLAGVTGAWRKAVQVTWHRFTDVWLLQNILLSALQAGLSGLLLWRWSRGDATPGDVAFAVTAFMLMSGYLRNLGENIRQVQKGLDDVEDVAGWLQTPPQVADAPAAPALQLRDPGQAGEIVFERVAFGYAGAGQPLYRGFDLTIRPGERVALVGPTGAGKSTFVKLLQRLYDLDGGRILLDGQDIAGVTQASLRQVIAVVPQDPALFHRSIAENIAYGHPDATPEQVATAARRARADGFIARLPSGYDTLVGERGVKLSGGERQRIAIARALLADAPILVLDEATSSLDVETEREVQAAMEAVMAGRTTVVIAHRLSTVRTADRILVFDQGRVVEQGDHAALLRQNGLYARLERAAQGDLLAA